MLSMLSTLVRILLKSSNFWDFRSHWQRAACLSSLKCELLQEVRPRLLHRCCTTIQPHAKKRSVRIWKGPADGIRVVSEVFGVRKRAYALRTAAWDQRVSWRLSLLPFGCFFTLMFVKMSFLYNLTLGFSRLRKRTTRKLKKGPAIVFALKHFQRFLLGKHFTLHTDHRKYLKIFGQNDSVLSTTKARLQRWAIFLSCFDYKAKISPATTQTPTDNLVIQSERPNDSIPKLPSSKSSI